ncbi:hypothetical protein [Streptococcus azizii]|nr:hypothetical protein [Streptococcus azizii]
MNRWITILKLTNYKTSATRVNQSGDRLLKVGNKTSATRVKRPLYLL